jgi:hypothetical protein
MRAPRSKAAYALFGGLILATLPNITIANAVGFAWAVVVALTSTLFFGAQAATLTGDTITQTDPTGTHSVLVGTGVDLTEAFLTFDYDAGTLGNEFIMAVGDATGPFFGAYTSAPVTSTITLSDLSFSGGQVLTGFNVLSSIFGPITVDILSSTSLSLSFFDGATIPTGNTELLTGDFITGPAATPVPAALPLFATGLGALGLLGWRKRRKNASPLPAA